MDKINTEYDIEKFNSILNEKYDDMISDKITENIPKAYVLGGQPGAGKTSLQKMFSKQCNDNLIIINGDEFRSMHPNFEEIQKVYGKDSINYTGAFSSKITESLIDKIGNAQLNILVEGTLRTAQVPINTCDDFKLKGYDVTLAIMAVKPQISYLSTIMRYEAMIDVGSIPRATPKENHDRVVTSLPKNLKIIFESKKFDNIVIYNRVGTCLYNMQKDIRNTPDTVMNEMLFGKWTQNELDQFFDIGTLTQNYMKKRNASELNDYKSALFNADIINELIKSNNLMAVEKIKDFFPDFNFYDNSTLDQQDKKFMYKIINSDIFKENKTKFSGICKYSNSKDRTILKYNPLDEEKVNMILDSIAHCKDIKSKF